MTEFCNCTSHPRYNVILWFVSDSELKEDKLQNLPSFLEALGFIVEEMDEVLCCCINL